MKVSKKHFVSGLSALALALTVLPSASLAAQVNVVSDNFDDYTPVTLDVYSESDKGPMTAYGGNTNIATGDVVLAEDFGDSIWVANKSESGKSFSGWGTSTAAIIQNPLADAEPGDNVLAIEGRAEWTAYTSTPTVRREDVRMSADTEYIYKFDMCRVGTDNAGAVGTAFRFNVTGKTYYELFFAGWNGNCVQLSRVTNGTREILDATVTGRTERLYEKHWHTVTVDVFNGKISWSVEREGSIVQTGKFDDGNNALSSANTTVELASRGQGKMYSLFDNFSIQKNQIIEDPGDFESLYETEPVIASSKGPVNILGRWYVFPRTNFNQAGFDGKATCRIAKDPTESGSNVLSIESRSEWDKPNTFPVVYNELMTTEGGKDYTYKFDIYRNGGNAGGGIRFNLFDGTEGPSFYELYFAGGNSGNNAAFLSKSTNGVYTNLPATISSSKNGEYWAEPNRLVSREWHNVLLKVIGNIISWEVQDKDGDIVQTGYYEESSIQANASMQTAFFGAGQGNEYIVFDNIYQTQFIEDFTFENYQVANAMADKYANKTLYGNWMIMQATTGQWSGWDSKSQYGIAEVSGMGKALKLESRSEWDKQSTIPMIYNTTWKKTSSGEYIYSFKFLRTSGNAGGGIRFNYSGSGENKTFYELYFNRETGVQVGKCVDGEYTVLESTVTTNPNTNWTYWSGKNGLIPSAINTVDLVVKGGNISWTVNHPEVWWQTGSCVDPNPINDLGTDTVLFAAGQGGEFVYFDDIDISENKLDDGSLEPLKTTALLSPGTNDIRLAGDWFLRGTTNDERFGYDDKAKAQIFVNDNSKVLSIEAKAAYTNNNQVPLVYNAKRKANASEDTVYSFDMKKMDSRIGAIIRFNYSKTDAQHKSFYQLSFDGSNGSNKTVLSKVVDGNTSAVQKLVPTVDTNVSALKSGTWYSVALRVNGSTGTISWAILDRATRDVLETGSYTDPDYITGEDLLTFYGAMGQGGNYVYFDNLKQSVFVGPTTIKDYNNGVATIVSDSASDAIVIIAAYDAAGRLVGASYESTTLTQGTNTVTAKASLNAASASTVKVILVDDDLAPLCEAYTKKLVKEPPLYNDELD